jgi:hypothetical protein
VFDIEKELLRRFSDGPSGEVTILEGERRLLTRVDVSATNLGRGRFAI